MVIPLLIAIGTIIFIIIGIITHLWFNLFIWLLIIAIFIVGLLILSAITQILVSLALSFISYFGFMILFFKAKLSEFIIYEIPFIWLKQKIPELYVFTIYLLLSAISALLLLSIIYGTIRLIRKSKRF